MYCGFHPSVLWGPLLLIIIFWIAPISNPPLTVKVEVETKTKKFDLIDQFLQAKPKIKPDKSSEKIDVSVTSISENETLMTETLARVYLEQKKYDKWDGFVTYFTTSYKIFKKFYYGWHTKKRTVRRELRNTHQQHKACRQGNIETTFFLYIYLFKRKGFHQTNS